MEALSGRRLTHSQVHTLQVDDDRKGPTMSHRIPPLPSRRHLLYGALAIPLGAAGMSLAACANKSGEAAADPHAPLNVGQISNSVAFFPLHVAESKGFFEDEAVTLGERPRLGTGAKLAAALTSVSIDIGAGVLTDAFNMAGVDDGTVITTSLVTEYYVDIIVAKDFDGPAADAPLEEKIQSLVGRNIGITGPGSGTEALLTYLFGLIGKDPKTDSTMVNLGGAVTAAVGAMSGGDVEVLAFFQPVGQQVETEGLGSIYLSPARGDVPDMAGQLHGVVFASGDGVSAKRTQIDAFNAAIGSALTLIGEGGDEVRELLTEYLENTPEETVDKLLEILPHQTPDDPAPTQEAYDIGAAFHMDSGLVDEAPDFADFHLGN